MAVLSKINPNFPIPGIDQSSKGFRDNFGVIKNEIENLQSKTIQLTGSLISDPVEIGNGAQGVIIPVLVSLTNIQAAGSNLSVQYNNNGVISGSQVYYNDNKLGIGSSVPQNELDVSGNATIRAPYNNKTFLFFGPNVTLTNDVATANIHINNGLTDDPAVTINVPTRNVGIGTNADSRLSVASEDNDVATFHAYKPFSDNSIRFSTVHGTSSIGLVLEQRNANSVGGLRLDANGNISIHVNESMDANLSDASRVIVILPNNNVGIGSMTPKNQLDVDGNAFVAGSVGIGTAVDSDALGVYGNIRIHNTAVVSGIFFADGTFQNTAGGGGGGGPGTTGPTGPGGMIGPPGPQSLQDHIVYSTVAPAESVFDTTPYSISNAYMELFINGNYQSVDSYSWSGNTLTLNDPVPPDTTVEMVIYSAFSLATNTGPTGYTGYTGPYGPTGATPGTNLGFSIIFGGY
jgi:hypothetical protein